MTCYFCGRPIKGTAIHIVGHPDKQFHPLEDEYGNATPGDIPSCWQKSDNGRLTLKEYLVELYADET